MSNSDSRPSDNWGRLMASTLLTAAQNATSRTRTVFLFVNVAGAIILAAQFSAIASWLRWTFHRAKMQQPLPQGILEQMYAAYYRDLSVVAVPVLGIRFHVVDIQLFGSLGMAILTVWWFYCTRRENHAIADLVFEARKCLANTPEAALVYFYGVVNHFVFSTTTNRDTPSGEHPRQEARVAVRVLALMPVWVPLLVIGMDLISLFVVNLAGIDDTKPLWQNLSGAERGEAVVRDAIALVVSAFCLRLCILGGQFDKDTRRAMEGFGKDIRAAGLTRNGAPMVGDSGPFRSTQGVEK